MERRGELVHTHTSAARLGRILRSSVAADSRATLVQPLRKPLPGLRKTDTAVEVVRVVPSRRSVEEEQGAATCSSFGFDRVDQRAADAFPAMRLRYDKRTQSGSRLLVLDRGRRVQMCEPDYFVLELGHDDAIAHDHQSLEPRFHPRRLGRIAQLAQELRNCRRVGGPRIPDRQIHASRIWAVLGEVLTAIVTPFRRDGTIDFECFRELAQHLVESGSDGIVVAGTTGESPTLSDDERLELFRVAVDTLKGRATVIAGTGTYSTAHSVHLTREAHELGVDGFLVVTPYYNKPPARGIVEHFRTIAAVSDRPIIVYNIPGRVVINIEPETIVELAEIPTVRAVKRTSTCSRAKR